MGGGIADSEHVIESQWIDFPSVLLRRLSWCLSIGLAMENAVDVCANVCHAEINGICGAQVEIVLV